MSTDFRKLALEHGISVSRCTVTGKVENLNATLSRIRALYEFLTADKKFDGPATAIYVALVRGEDGSAFPGASLTRESFNGANLASDVVEVLVPLRQDVK